MPLLQHIALLQHTGTDLLIPNRMLLAVYFQNFSCYHSTLVKAKTSHLLDVSPPHQLCNFLLSRAQLHLCGYCYALS